MQEAEKHPTTPCPVLEAARELARLEVVLLKLGEESGSLCRGSPEFEAICRQEAYFGELADVQRQRIATGRATSLGGAMAQVMIAASLMDVLSSDLPSHIRVEMALYSVLAVLEREAGIDREEFAGETYMPARLDPHSAVTRLTTPV
jgi:hypothetical protein